MSALREFLTELQQEIAQLLALRDASGKPLDTLSLLDTAQQRWGENDPRYLMLLAKFPSTRRKFLDDYQCDNEGKKKPNPEKNVIVDPKKTGHE
jgi:hypothetical protein